MNRDAIAGLGLLVLAGAYATVAGGVQDSGLSDEVGPTGLPFVLAVLLAGLAVLLIARSLLAGRASALGRTAPAAADDDEEPAAPPRRVLGLVGLGALYALLAPALDGYQSALDNCSAKGIVQDARRDLKLIQKAGIEGLEPVFDLLEKRIGD